MSFFVYRIDKNLAMLSVLLYTIIKSYHLSNLLRDITYLLGLIIEF